MPDGRGNPMTTSPPETDTAFMTATKVAQMNKKLISFYKIFNLFPLHYNEVPKISIFLSDFS